MRGSGALKERVANLAVERGLFVVRYASSHASAAPSVFVRPSPSCEESVQVVSTPGGAQGVLTKPGDCVVIVAAAAGSLHVTVSTRSADGDLDANIRMETITSSDPVAPNGLGALQGAAPRKAPVAPRRASATQKSPIEPRRIAARLKRSEDSHSEFAVAAHVARRGDLVVAPGEWVGGPSAPAPIEGLQINWAPPIGVALEYQVLVVGAGGRWSTWVFAGEFAGSRGRRLSLVGVRMRLGGEQADRYSLYGEALFLGAPIVSDKGRELEFLSRSGTDPLVGLRLELNEMASDGPDLVAETKAEARVAGRVGTNDVRRGGRVRVFRSPRAMKAEDSLDRTRVFSPERNWGA